MTAPYCARCSVGDAIHTRGPDHLCAACAEDWDGATAADLLDILAAMIDPRIFDSQPMRRAA